ncbi:MAG: DUF6573 family protein [Deferribacterales bacterium]
MEIFGEVIHSYSRAQAIEDGILVDMSEYVPEGESKPLVKQAGFKVPLAVTRAVYDRLLSLPDSYIGCQSVTGRFWDILTLLHAEIKRSAGGDQLIFGVYSRKVNNNGSDGRLELVKLKAVIGPGDTPEPVLTVMFPEED